MESLREEIERDYVVERTGWAAERVARVCEQLQRGVAPTERLEALVVWFAEHTAFTTLGDTVYISRRLLERLPDDDAAALVIAHELAHHRLGHIPHPSMSVLPLRLAIALLDKLVHSPQRETAADLLAIELCLAAGYDLERCLAAFEILALIALDYGDVDGVLGSERRRSHPAIAHRIAAIRAHVAAMAQGTRVDIRHEIARDRQRRRRRFATLATGVAAAAVGVVVLRRLPGR